MTKQSHLILYLSILLLSLLCPATLTAQSNDQREIYAHAEREYQIGRLEQARQLLTDNLETFNQGLRESAYRLLSLCCLGLDEEEQAEAYVKQLIASNPYYSTTANDPMRFIDMVNIVKNGAASTITTASIQAESLSEVPVPTTLITEEMIRNCGATNLQEVLAAYVPGMNIIDCNDDINIAMRGIFSNGQEKILIMLNGHRLNSFCTNTAAPDFSIGLEKLKQIEVLRGPASSLYGGVALTAVVNLITKQGADVDGFKLKGSIGNYGQRRADAMLGKRYFDIDVLLWGSIYESKGEERDLYMNDETATQYLDTVTIGAIGKKPSYEFGITMKWKDYHFMYNAQFSQVRAPFTISTSASYDYDKYKTYNGLKPGYATQSHHVQLSHHTNIGKFYMQNSLNYDNTDLTHYQVISDKLIPHLGELFGLSGKLSEIFDNNGGTSRYINGQEQTLGWQMKGDFNYINTKTQKGHITIGAEYSRFKLEDMRYNIGYDFSYSSPENAAMTEMGKGKENSYNAFLQLKHNWHSFIVNAGLRYDHKNRYDDTKVNELSPRLALILVRPKWNLKLSYSKSFVDAPYLYRKTNEFLVLINNDMESSTYNDADLNATIKLDPELFHSWQLTFAGNEWVDGLNFEVNLFHNRAKELIFTEMLTHINSGQNRTIGAELMASYHTKRFSSNLNLSWIRTLRSNLIYKDVDRNNNTPTVTSNLVMGWQATNKLKIHSKLSFESKQTSYNVSSTTLMKIQELNETLTDVLNMGNQELIDELMDRCISLIDNELVQGEEMAPRLLINIGADYKLKSNFMVSFNMNNLLNTKYFRSGMNTGLVPQRGRWYMFSIGIGI